MTTQPIKVYWAAPCFSQGERLWNRLCASCLEGMGYIIMLPQDEAPKPANGDGGIDFTWLAENCRKGVEDADIVVAVLDGPDPDSGTSVECGIAITIGKKIIGVRTDFRTSEDGHLNAMFRLIKNRIYFPSFNESHELLCQEIHLAIASCMSC